MCSSSNSKDLCASYLRHKEKEEHKFLIGTVEIQMRLRVNFVHLTKLCTERGNKLNIPIIHPTVWVIIVQHPYLLIKEHND